MNPPPAPLRLVLLLPALLVLLPGLPALSFDFVYDDNTVVLGAAEVVAERGAGLLGSERLMERPLPTLSFAAERRLFGATPWAFHLMSLLWGSLNAALVAWLVLTVSGSARAALIGGCLFAAHPLHVEAVYYVAGRQDLMAAAFGITALTLLSPGLTDGRRCSMVCSWWAILVSISINRSRSMIIVPLLVSGTIARSVLG